jgi:hypothetical protein
MVDEPNRSRCWEFLNENERLLKDAMGSSHNHQAWPGGYLDHVSETMTIAAVLHHAMSKVRPLSFSLSDALVVMFLHDIEKPFKVKGEKLSKKDRRQQRESIIRWHGFRLTAEQENAMLYVEGEGDDYRADRRVMNELAAFCHMCDVASARVWHDQPLKEDNNG